MDQNGREPTETKQKLLQGIQKHWHFYKKRRITTKLNQKFPSSYKTVRDDHRTLENI